MQDDRACESILDAALMGTRNHEDSRRKAEATKAGERLVVFIVSLSLRQRRNAKARLDVIEAHERAARAERDLEIAQEQARQRTDADR